ncbi:hypothetical protein BBP40_008022 [Aspergillus hancockii]|nr:hypothetical protein BBP40_008022 [Aspergillus hancockii]
MKVTIKEWNAVATWRWDMPEDDVCGICRVQFDGTCPTCKFPGDDCSLPLSNDLDPTRVLQGTLSDVSAEYVFVPRYVRSWHTTTTSLSSSPSKQSILRVTDSNVPSRPESAIERPATARQNHTFSQEQHTHELAEGVTSPYHENERPHEIPSTSHPPFQPFFTLVEDANTSEYYHPTVHYIFSDDDTDIVTEAALRSLEFEQENHPRNGNGKSRSTRDRHPDEGDEDEDDELSLPRKGSLLPPPIPGVRDNYIILDMDALYPDDTHNMNPALGHDASAGSPGTHSAIPQQQQNPQQHSQQGQPGSASHQFTVTSAYSLTPAWQVLNTQLVPAPTFENNSSGEQSPNGGLMLKIRGTSGLPITMPGRDRDKDNSTQRLEDMMEQFSKRLVELRQVIEAGEQAHVSESVTEEHKPIEEPNTEDIGITSERQPEIQTRTEDDMISSGQRP